jgi:hypothetical protein
MIDGRTTRLITSIITNNKLPQYPRPYLHRSMPDDTSGRHPHAPLLSLPSTWRDNPTIMASYEMKMMVKLAILAARLAQSRNVVEQEIKRLKRAVSRSDSTAAAKVADAVKAANSSTPAVPPPTNFTHAGRSFRVPYYNRLTPKMLRNGAVAHRYAGPAEGAPLSVGDEKRARTQLTYLFSKIGMSWGDGYTFYAKVPSSKTLTLPGHSYLLTSKDGSIVWANGEIYNKNGLRASLYDFLRAPEAKQIGFLKGSAW